MRLSKFWSRIKKVSLTILCLTLLLSGIIVTAALLKIPRQQTFDTYSLPTDFKTLDQNWDADIRQQMHYSSFGSRIMPYDLFTHLELADSDTLLSDNEVLDSLGFITQRPAKNNPAGLPIGFAIDNTGEAWVGLTCTSCHTGMLTHQGTKILVEGGPGMLDFNRFERTVYDALHAALMNEEKFSRLVERMGADAKTSEKIKSVLEARYTFFKKRLKINEVDVAYGHGRLDAFGRIFNAVTATALEMPDNYHTPDAPVSIPMIWDASHLDLVQWNASAFNTNPGPLGQNVTTALAVYGEIDITDSGGWGYSSSVNIPNLGYIQSRFYKLQSPMWPEQVLGTLDTARVEQGKAIYQDNCVSCHAVIDRTKKDRELLATVVPLDVVKTDPVMARNFATRESATGPLQGKKENVLGGAAFPAQAQTISIVINAAVGAMVREPISSLAAFLAENKRVYKGETDMRREAYKARSLNGVWATGPFLHNGSVPTLYDLLQKPENRPTTFYVGSREMDTKKVGLVYEHTERSSLFDTRLHGNGNMGHEFGTDLSEDEKWSLIEYLKSL